MSSKKTSIFSAIIHEKCPKCREGKIFAYPFYYLNKFAKMYEKCPLCGFKFEKEPGFFFGAMYISYAITVAILIGSAVILNYGFDDPPLWVYLICAPGLLILLLPFIFRYSRILYLYIFWKEE